MRERFEDIRIPVAKNISLSAWLKRPAHSNRSSIQALIFVHGFGSEKTENGLFSEAFRSLPLRRYSILTYDWRGLGASEGVFANTSLYRHTEDFRRVTQFFSKSVGIPTSSICAIGFSLGAAIVAGAIRKGLDLGAACFWSPAVRPAVSMWPRYSTPELRKELNARGYIIKPGSKNLRLGRTILESLRTTDFGSSAFRLGIPLLVCHGTDDVRIPFAHTLELLQHSEGLGDLEFRRFNGASHSFRPEIPHRKNLFHALELWLSSSRFRSHTRSSH